jgi:ABC-type phosphate/phosphonate transport system substrate-binding protein
MSMKRLLCVLLLISLMFVLAACRREAPQAAARPTQTPTPRSTTLPPVPTTLPIGAVGNPVRVLLVPRPIGVGDRAIALAGQALTEALPAAAGIAIDLAIVRSDAEAAAEVCASTPERVRIAWVSGAGYAAIHAAGCGSAVMRAVREEGETRLNGESVVLYANQNAGISALADINGKTLCRLNIDDLYTSVIPLVMLRAASGETAITPARVRSYESLDLLVPALADGECDAAGLRESDYEEYANPQVRAVTGEVARSVELPFAVLVTPQFLPLAQRAAIIDAFTTIGNGSEAAAALRPILGHSAVIRADDSDFSRLRSFFTQARIDLARLGS